MSEAPRYHNLKRNLVPPSEAIEAARMAMGGIDLAPYVPEESRSSYMARVSCSEQAMAKALTTDWKGRVLLTPPLRQPVHGRYIERMLEQYAAGNISQGVIISNSPEMLRMLPELFDFPMCIPYRRLRYTWVDVNSILRVSSPSSWNFIVFMPAMATITEFNHSIGRFRSAFEPIGRVVFDSSGNQDWREQYVKLPNRTPRAPIETGVWRWRRGLAPAPD